MRIYLQRDTDIGKVHQVLKTLYINTSLLQIGAEGMAEHIGHHMGNAGTIELCGRRGKNKVPSHDGLPSAHSVPPSRRL